MIDETVLDAASRYVQTFFGDDATGHDWHHMVRVRRLAERIAVQEGADRGIVALAALLHDVDDAKLSPATSDDLGNARAFLANWGISPIRII